MVSECQVVDLALNSWTILRRTANLDRFKEVKMSRKYRLAIFAFFVFAMVAFFSNSASAQRYHAYRGPHAGPGYYHAYYASPHYYHPPAVDVRVGPVGVHVDQRPVYHRDTVYVTPAPVHRRQVIIQPAPYRERVIIRRGWGRW